MKLLALIPTILLLLLLFATHSYNSQRQLDPRNTLKVQYEQVLNTGADDVEKILMKARMETRNIK